MVFELHTQTIFPSILVIVFLFGQSCHVTECFQVNLQLYFNTTPVGDHINFETNQPNLDVYSKLLPKVQLACGQGWWYAYNAANYQSPWGSLGSYETSQTACRSINGQNMKSLRYIGVNETTRNTLSLFGATFYSGNDILLEEQAYTDIKTPIISVSGTGNSQWKLFEGPYLDGKSKCITVPMSGSIYFWENDVRDPARFNLTTVGSVFRGCNIVEIEEYKRNNIK